MTNWDEAAAKYGGVDPVDWEKAAAKYGGKSIQSTGADQNLGGTLPFLGMDTGIPIPAGLESFLIGAGKSASRMGQGIRQILPGDNTALNKQVASENALYAPLAKDRPWSTGLGEALPAFAIPVGGAGGVAATLGRSALASAIPGAVEYGTPLERAQRAAIGAGAGALGAGIGYGAGRIINPIRSANPVATGEAAELARAAGINFTPAQATGNKVLGAIEGTFAQYPGSASTMANIIQRQKEGFNRASMGVMGEPLTANIANDAAILAKKNIGGRIDVAAAGVPVRLDEQLITDLGNVEAKYMRNLTSDQKPFVRNSIDDILNAAGSQNVVPGETYQAWRSRIGARAEGTSDSEYKGALKGIQKSLDAAFNRSAPPEAMAAMTAARGQYRNFKTLEPLLEKAAMSSSNIPPAQVMSRALATGNTAPGPMQNLAQLGQIVGRDYPNSGTAPRMLWQGLLQNPARALNPIMWSAPFAWGAANLMQRGPGRSYLTNQLMTQELERLLMRGGGLLGYAGANATAP